MQVKKENTIASVTTTFTNGTTANALEVNQNFTDLVNEFNATTGHDHDGTDAKIITKAGTETANGTGTVTISNLAPNAVVTATISAWMQITVGSTTYYIPLWK